MLLLNIATPEKIIAPAWIVFFKLTLKLILCQQKHVS